MNELYRTYEVLVEESVHPNHPKREKANKPCLWELDNGEKDAALRDTHMIFQDAVCYYTLCLAGLAGKEVAITGTLEPPSSPTGGSVDIVDILSKRVVGGGLTGTSEAIIAGVIVGASVGTAVGIYEADQSKPPASQ